jgi:hypothetical protein
VKVKTNFVFEQKVCSGGGWWIMWIHVCDMNMEVHSNLCSSWLIHVRTIFFPMINPWMKLANDSSELYVAITPMSKSEH